MCKTNVLFKYKYIMFILYSTDSCLLVFAIKIVLEYSNPYFTSTFAPPLKISTFKTAEQPFLAAM